ncbi:glycosyltransferase [Microbacterium karelineae]|uniref:glycosyltransferase n=1 Tax=Microbacterium karelineae TaxID=2654283 RepID=UPI0012E9C208|nr:glycosyltransferase [Microbacterium karelineae]
MSRDRIGYVVKMYPRFSETFVVSEIIARERRGADIRIFSLRPTTDARFHDTLSQVAAPVEQVPRAAKASEMWELLRRAEPELPLLPDALGELLAAEHDDAGQAVELALAIRRHGITRLHAHFASVATTVARLASRLTGIPYAFTAHAKDLFHESVDPADIDRKIADASHVVTVSDFNVRHLRARYPAADRTPVRRVYNGIDLERFVYDPRREGESGILAVGRLVEKKGFADLIAASAMLRDAGRPTPCRIVGGGDLEDALRGLAARLGLDDLVTFTGPLPQREVRAELARARVFVAPCVVGADGNADGLPTVLLEAMAIGTPCISTDVTGITEAVRDGDTGLVVPQRAPRALAAAIERILDEPALAARLAASARDLVAAEFDVRRQSARLEEVA